MFPRLEEFPLFCLGDHVCFPRGSRDSCYCASQFKIVFSLRSIVQVCKRSVASLISLLYNFYILCNLL